MVHDALERVLDELTAMRVELQELREIRSRERESDGMERGEFRLTLERLSREMNGHVVRLKEHDDALNVLRVHQSAIIEKLRAIVLTVETELEAKRRVEDIDREGRWKLRAQWLILLGTALLALASIIGSLLS